MKALKFCLSLIAYTLAFSCVVLALVTFLGLQVLPKMLITSTGLTVNPRYTGGEVTRTVRHDTYETRIYRPVFDGLLGPRSEGFVQVDWRKKNAVPHKIDEDIDYDGDGKPDFHVVWETRTDTVTLTATNPKVQGLGGTYVGKDRYILRVNLRNPSLASAR